MKYKNIPQTELNPSVICLGAGPFGVDLSQEISFSLLDRFFAEGGNFIDTALVYGEWLPNGKGLSEKTVGNWLKTRGNRSKVIIGTKGAHPRLSTMLVGRLSREEINSDVDESLHNLQTDYIDLYWLHRDDATRPVAEILSALNGLVKAGKIRYFGCSNWQTERIREAQDYAASNGLQGFAGNQVMWSFARPNREAINDKTLVSMDPGLKGYHRASGLAAMAYNSQARGFFAKLDQVGGALERLSPALRQTFGSPENLAKFARLKKLSEAQAQPVSALSLAYLIAQPFPAYPIAGCSTLDQLAENLQAANIELEPSLAAYLDTGN
jgi:aryl-alcohol dehydrogenase-like predicted oxidoreductase